MCSEIDDIISSIDIFKKKVSSSLNLEKIMVFSKPFFLIQKSVMGR